MKMLLLVRLRGMKKVHLQAHLAVSSSKTVLQRALPCSLLRVNLKAMILMLHLVTLKLQSYLS
jgi:hypothetical protein